MQQNQSIKNDYSLAEVEWLWIYSEEMSVQVLKWGNNLAVRLPVVIVEALGLKEGDEIEITVARTRRFEIAGDRSRAEALELIRRLARPLPSDFKFDREEANERKPL